MRTAVACLFTILVLTGPGGADEASWIRYPALSPDGNWITFSYGGDLWLAPVGSENTTRASLLTTHEGYERSPVWSSDSKHIAFCADWYGQFDVFVTSVERAPARRLTFHSSDDTPTSFTPDGRSILFSSARVDGVQARIGTTFLPELYRISVEGGMPELVLTTTAEYAQYNPDGNLLVYQDRKGYEDEWRKHHVSSVTRDLWVWDPGTGEHTKITDFRGEDRNPVWLADGETIVFLSEKGGTFNVWQTSIEDPKKSKVLTAHAIHPCRFLSAANDGTLAYTYNGGLWLRRPDRDSVPFSVHAQLDDRVNNVKREILAKGATEIAVSPNEEEVAFVLRGDLFAASLDHGTTKRLTATPEQERSLSWAKDGRTLYFAGERDESWNLYQVSLVREDEELFCRSTLLDEEPVLVSEHETFQPVASPDGKWLAYVHDRDAIYVRNLESKTSKALVPADLNYSYADGDIDFSWSPDSAWLAFNYLPNHRWGSEVGVASIATAEIVNVTLTGYDEGSSRWSPTGDALLFRSGRYGRQEHSGRGSDEDVFAVYLTQEAYDRAILSKEDFEALKKREEKEKKKKKKKDKEKSKEESASDEDSGATEKAQVAKADAEDRDEDGAEKEDEEKVKPVVVETDGLEKRIRRLTLHSARTGDFALTPDGEHLIYLARVDRRWDLWVTHLRERSTKRLVELGDRGAGSFRMAKDGKSLVLRRQDGRLAKVSISKGPKGSPSSGKSKPIAFRAEMTIDGAAERAHLFEHVWRQVREKFYRDDLHGVDWVSMKENYAAFLPHLKNKRDFSELLSEMLGELNASHTGSRHRTRREDADQTASLGLLFDGATENGLKVAEVLQDGPCDRAESKIVPGTILAKVDGVELGGGRNLWELLNRRADQPVLLTLQRAGEEDSWEEVIKPISRGKEGNLLYERWVRRSRELVKELSNDTIGYVHVRGMDDASYRHVYDEALGRFSDHKALIVDTRFNGGGWLHDQLITFLGGETYCQLKPRGKKAGQLGGEPITRWSQPVLVVQNEGNYSDAHFFPYSFRTLELGKLLGAPVAGTATAVWWERLMDGETVFGIPQVGVLDRNGDYLENQELFPDILVYNDPKSVAEGRDVQLERAVQVMFQEIDAK